MLRIALSRPTQLTTASLAQGAMNILMLVLFVLLAIASYKRFMMTATLQSFGILAVNTLFVVLYLNRRPAIAESPSLPLWILACGGSTLPLLMRSSDVPGFLQLGTAVQIAGLALLAAALLSLRRSFAVVPANRGIRDGGLYRIVRHPVYLAELLVFLGIVLVSPTAANLAIWLCECGLQFARACAEERFLATDPAYRAYRIRVRYRLIPGVV
jgi:protein-S-isoprenylcysteine O-methyltransferase Ste14